MGLSLTVELNPTDPRRVLARRVFDALVGEVPVMGPLLEAIWGVTHLPADQRELLAWRQDITAKVNDLDAALAAILPRLALSDIAIQLGSWLSAHCTHGRGHVAEFTTVQAEFPDVPKTRLQDVVGELAHAGLLTVDAVIGNPAAYFRPTNSLYLIFDPSTHGTDPTQDAVQLARLILDRPDLHRASELCEVLGWTTRRFNPAAALIQERVGSNFYSRTIDAQYVWASVHFGPIDRAALRREFGIA